MSDWYLVTQLKNFREGVRGAHDDDKYGMQMAMMAATLQTNERINNVVAYINPLPGKPERVARSAPLNLPSSLNSPVTIASLEN
jgi:cytochrome c553